MSFFKCITDRHTSFIIPYGRFRVDGFSRGFASNGGGGGGGGSAVDRNFSQTNDANPAVLLDGNAANGDTLLYSFEPRDGTSLVPGGAGCSIAFFGILYADFRL